MAEEELTPEEIVKRIEEELEEAKKLPGGIGAYMFMTKAKKAEANNGKERQEKCNAQIAAYGDVTDLAILYFNVPKNIKRIAAIMDIKNIFSED